MSRKLISHSPDLQKLENDGYEIEVKQGHLLVSNIPYVNSRGEVAHGVLVSKLDLAGEKTTQPESHVMYFIGDHPCEKDGSIITAIQNESVTKSLVEGLTINHTFSGKPPGRLYLDYFEKVTQYVKVISSQAQAINPDVTAKTFNVKESTEPESTLCYHDTNSTRSEISAISEKLHKLKIAIVGTGGTGSYVLDFVSKTGVKEIHIFDEDVFLQHNAFRAPGAASLDVLKGKPKKVAYLREIYSKMHKVIIPHEHNVTAANANEIAGMDFTFVCVDKPEAKGIVISQLISKGISFVDVGMGIKAINDSLTGSARITTGTQEKYDHIEKRISFASEGQNDYKQNIQIAELNALNAALAVIKWKKLYGVYHDLEKEFHSSYSVNMNKILNDEIKA